MTRLIKRYENRKLYDTTDRTYVSLKTIAAHVRAGETVQIVDQKTGQDLTVQILTQVILEEGKHGQPLFSTDFLHDLLRRSSTVMDSGLQQIKERVDGMVQNSMSRVGQLLKGTRSDELEQLRTQLDGLESLLHQFLNKKDPEQPDETSSETQSS